jgi:hypothetical protein
MPFSVREFLPANNLSKRPIRTTARRSAGSLLFPRSTVSSKENHYTKGFGCGIDEGRHFISYDTP